MLKNWSEIKAETIRLAKDVSSLRGLGLDNDDIEDFIQGHKDDLIKLTDEGNLGYYIGYNLGS